MSVLQLNVFIENQLGRLSEVTSALNAAGVNIRALFVADTQEFGILRLIVDKPELAQETIKTAGFTCNLTSIIPITISDKPGELDKALKALSDNGVELKYLYAYAAKDSTDAIVVIKAGDDEAAIKFFNDNGINVLSEQEVYQA